MTTKNKVEKKQNFIGEHAVLYTDGGCRPSSKGFGGSGVHGYFYKMEVPKTGAGAKLTPTPSGYLNLKELDPKLEPIEQNFTGVSELRKHPLNPVAVTVLAYFDFWKSFDTEVTNNISEIEALTEALDIALDTKLQSLLILADSTYVINGITKWVNGWIKRNWKDSNGNQISNVDYWKLAKSKYDALVESGCNVIVEHVRGHSGDIGNDLADEHATKGVILSMEGIRKRQVTISDAKGYWSPKVDFNPFLNKSTWYFSVGHDKDNFKSCDGRHVYMLGEHGPDDRFIGKKTSVNNYSVIYLKEPELVLESIKDRQAELTSGDSIVTGKLRVIKEPSRYTEIKKYGTGYLYVNPKSPKLDLLLPNGMEVTREMKPVRLAYNAIEYLTLLDGILEGFVEKTNLQLITEITDQFYDYETNKKGKVVAKLKKSITTSTRSHTSTVAVGNTKKQHVQDCKMLFDIDLPNRNTLNALASPDTKVYVLTWLESATHFRFATIVETKDDIGIWSSVHSNLKRLDAIEPKKVKEVKEVEPVPPKEPSKWNKPKKFKRRSKK